MNIRLSRPVPRLAITTAVFLTVALAACRGPDLSPGAAPLVAGQAPVSPERVAAIAEMRRLGEASDALPYPGAFQAEQTKRLAARQEPRPGPDATAIQAELAALAVLRQAATTPEEIAELRVREAELRQSIHDQAGKVQR
jgi:hypothetical protein